jgi:hypothetical protein
MASNGKPQFVKNIFLQQPKGGLAAAGDASVWQDKVRASPVRIGTNQPVPLTKITRTQKVARKKPRSQNRPTPKRQRVLIGVWVQPIVKEELQRIAKREGVSVSKTSAAFLEQALQQNIDLKHSALLTPIIEAAIDKRMRSRDSRLAWLLVRIAFDTGQNRSLLTNILGRQQGMTEDMLKTILAMSQRTAKGNITRRTPQIAELMEAVEQWLAPDNGNREGNLHY